MENAGVTQAHDAGSPPSHGGKMSDRALLNSILLAREEAERSRHSRLTTNRRNMLAFLGQQDFSDKIPGQSREFLPKTAVAVQRFAEQLERALVSAVRWFTTEFTPALNISMTEQAQAVVAIAPFLEPQPESFLSPATAIGCSTSICATNW